MKCKLLILIMTFKKIKITFLSVCLWSYNRTRLERRFNLESTPFSGWAFPLWHFSSGRSGDTANCTTTSANLLLVGLCSPRLLWNWKKYFQNTKFLVSISCFGWVYIYFFIVLIRPYADRFRVVWGLPEHCWFSLLYWHVYLLDTPDNASSEHLQGEHRPIFIFIYYFCIWDEWGHKPPTILFWFCDFALGQIFIAAPSRCSYFRFRLWLDRPNIPVYR